MGGASSRKQMEEALATLGQVKPWGSVFVCPFSDWTKHQGALWGFDQRTNYSTRQESRLQPWATKGHHFVAQIPAPETQDIDMSAVRMYATMAIEEKRNMHQVQCVDLPFSYFKDGLHFVEVVTYRDHHVIVQVATKHQRMDFLIVDLEMDTVRVVHREYVHSKCCLYECAMSPDFSRILLKPNQYYAHFHNVQVVRDLLQCITIAGPHVKRKPSSAAASTTVSRNSLRKPQASGPAKSASTSRKNTDFANSEVEGRSGEEPEEGGNFTLHEAAALRMAMVFDPRYQNSRVVLANVVEQGKPIILVYDIKTRRRLLQNDLHTSTQRTAQQLVFSPGGNFIAVPLVIGDYQTTPPFVMSDIKVFSAVTLDCLHTLPPSGTRGGYVNLVPVGSFPMFSSSGAFLVVPVSKTLPDPYQKGLVRVGSVSVHKVAPLMHLQSMCRTKVRQCVRREEIPKLPLPEAMKRFLLFIPFIE